MYSLLGYEENIRNIYKLCAASSANATSIKTTEELTVSFRSFLRSHQPAVPINTGPTKFVDDESVELQLVEAYSPSSLNDLEQQKLISSPCPTNEKKKVFSELDFALTILGDSDLRLRTLFDVVVHSLFVRKSKSLDGRAISAGGSSSSAIGVTWISDRHGLTKNDYAELLLHELTHHLIFIDERCNEQFNYPEMIKPENYALSALLGLRRPMDKVVHSIIVGTEILLARRSFMNLGGVTVHPKTDVLERQVLASIEDVFNSRSVNDVLTERTLFLLHSCRYKLTEMKEVA